MFITKKKLEEIKKEAVRESRREDRIYRNFDELFRRVTELEEMHKPVAPVNVVNTNNQNEKTQIGY